MSERERIATDLKAGAEILFLDAERAAHADGDLAPHYRAWECAVACREAAALLLSEPVGETVHEEKP